MSVGDSEQGLQRVLRLLGRSGVYSGVFGAFLCVYAATRLFTDALIEADVAVLVGLAGGLSLVVWISSLTAVRDLERISQLRREPTKPEVGLWILTTAGTEVLFVLVIGASALVVFGFIVALVGLGATAVLFGANWARTIRRFRTYRRSQGTA